MIGLLAMASALSVFETGNDLYSICQSEPQGECAAYIAGVADELGMLQAAGSIQPAIFCPSRRVSIGQARDVVIESLRDDPASRDQAAAALVSAALVNAFPCSN